MITTIITYTLAAVGIILLYETVRFIIKNKIIRRLNRSVRANIKQYDIKLDKYKFMNKFIVKQELMNDDDIHHAILHHARENGLDIQDVDEL
ncbi:MAG: hypothetical protein E4G96_09565, partial [Chrysiogenales bacterium]